MPNPDQYVVIMAGGIGSRFWPFSRKDNPKQFQDILGTGKTLIQQTVDRFEGICPKENIYVVTNEAYEGLVREQLPFMGADQILLEPLMRNTAPCVAYAAYKIASCNPNANLVIAPADHIILNEEVFRQHIRKALDITARHDVLATLGIRPTRPDTGYGYIQVLYDQDLEGIHKVKTFTEKPNLELAQTFMESGEFVWNAGIFIWNVQSILQKFRKHLPEMAEAFDEITPHYFTRQEGGAIRSAYYQSKNVSLDYGIMEHADNVYVLPGDFGWSDLGTWKSLYELADKNQDGNVVQGEVMLYETNDCIIKTPEEKLVIVQGLQNYIVAEYNGVLLICQKDQEQRIKQFVADVREQKGNRFE